MLRDITRADPDRQQGPFDRALTPTQRLTKELPSTATISRDEFIEATTDLWEIAPESATRVGHPAPLPAELPKRLIGLYTYEDDVVLDPFMGSGSSAVAALRTQRHYIGFDTDPEYVAAAEASITTPRFRVELPAVAPADESEDFQTRAVREGRQARDLGCLLIEGCGFTNIREDVKPRGLGIVLNFVATDATGNDWAFDVSGAFTSNRAGLRRTDTLSTMRGHDKPVFDLIELLSPEDQARLHDYTEHGTPS